MQHLLSCDLYNLAMFSVYNQRRKCTVQKKVRLLLQDSRENAHTATFIITQPTCIYSEKHRRCGHRFNGVTLCMPPQEVRGSGRK
ncbi:hypothetical protein FKM82_020706 [Ascaphus truei]